MRHYIWIALLFSSSLSFAGILTYDNNGKIVSVCRGGNIQNDDGYQTLNISDEHPIFTKGSETMKVVDGVLVDKSQEEISLIIKEKRKVEIRREVRQLKQQYLEAMSERAEGFSVIKETTTIRATIDALKVEYQSLNK